MTPWILVLLLVGIFQSSLLARLTLFGVHPNLMLIVVVSWGLLRGGREGLLWGMAGGLVLDVLSGAPFGVFTVAMLVVAFVAGLIETSLLRPTLGLLVGLVLLMSPLFQLVAVLMLRALDWPVGWGRAASLLLPAAAVDAGLTLLLFPLVRRLSRLAGDRAIEWR